LRDDQGPFAIFSTGACVSSSIEMTGAFTQLQRTNPCRVMMARGLNLLPLTDTGHVFVSQAMFKIIPYEDPQLVLS